MKIQSNVYSYPIKCQVKFSQNMKFKFSQLIALKNHRVFFKEMPYYLFNICSYTPKSYQNYKMLFCYEISLAIFSFLVSHTCNIYDTHVQHVCDMPLYFFFFFFLRDAMSSWDSAPLSTADRVLTGLHATPTAGPMRPGVLSTRICGSDTLAVIMN